MEFRGFNGLLEGHRWHQRWDAFCEHRFSGTRNAEHQQVVSSAHSDFNGTLGEVLAADIGKVIRATHRVLGEQRSALVGSGWDCDFAAQELDGLVKVFDPENFDSLDQRRLLCVRLRQDQSASSMSAGCQCDCQCAANRADQSGERKLSHDAKSLQGWKRGLLTGPHEAKRDGQIK